MEKRSSKVVGSHVESPPGPEGRAFATDANSGKDATVRKRTKNFLV